MGDASDDGIRIGFYEPWMADQVVDMIVDYYQRDREAEAHLFERFYEAPFQLENGIRLVALDGDTICGFQSYFYWPYVYGGRTLRSFQSGNSLVSGAYRGRRIFARLLSFLGEAAEKPEIDFLMGFPVEMSFGSFIRNGWDNPIDLSWMVRPIRPLSVVAPRVPVDGDWRFEREPEPVEPWYPEDRIALSKDEDFVAWRRDYRDDRPYHYFHHREAGGTIRFDLKPNRRGRVNELVIGDVVRDSPDPALLRGGLRALVRAARGHSFLTMLSIALNYDAADPDLVRGLRRRGFFRIDRKIHFIFKPVNEWPELLEPGRWQLFRSDIDTW